MNKLAGVGLVNLLIIALFTVVFIVAMKTVLTMHPLDGLTPLFQAV
jgi:cell division protein FtsL